MNVPQFEFEEGVMNVHTFWSTTSKHGPGNRFALWFQGCPLRCSGCTNPQMLAENEQRLMQVEDILSFVRQAVDCVEPIEGLTFMGGEPLAQSRVLSQLLKKLKEEFPDLNTLLFTGYRLEFLEACEQAEISEVLSLVDTIIDGPFVESKLNASTIAGSSNQRIVHVNKKRLEGRDFRRQGDSYGLEQMGDGHRLRRTAFSSSEFSTV